MIFHHCEATELSVCCEPTKIGRLSGSQESALIHSSVQVMSSLKEVNFTQPELSPSWCFFVLLLESNYIAETEIIAERVLFFSTEIHHCSKFLGDLSICPPGESK